MRQDNLSKFPSPAAHATGVIASQSDLSEGMGGATHDLHNLLAVIFGVCESLAEELDQNSEHCELARVGLLASERAADLVNRLRASPGPRAVAAAEPPPPPPTVSEGPRHSVLIIEDEPDLLQLMTAAFVRAGFKAYSARNGRQGLQLLGALKPDLMITDIVMPEMEGIALIMEARRCSPATRTIAISGGGKYGRSENFLQWAEELGADEALAKPFAMSSLMVAARLVIDRGPRQQVLDIAATG